MPVRRTSIRAAVATPTEQSDPVPLGTAQTTTLVEQQLTNEKKEQIPVIQSVNKAQDGIPERIKTGFTLRKDLLKDVKRLAVEEETDINNLLEEGMRLVLESRKKT